MLRLRVLELTTIFILWENIADFDLEAWRVKLDEQGLKIGDNQENSLKNRRKLAESTRGKLVCVSLVLAVYIRFSDIRLSHTVDVDTRFQEGIQ